MKTRLIRCGVTLAIAMLMLSSAVLAVGGPPENPGGVCDRLAELPLPAPVLQALLDLFGCEDPTGCEPPNC